MRTRPIVGCRRCCCCGSCGEVCYLLLNKVAHFFKVGITLSKKILETLVKKKIRACFYTRTNFSVVNLLTNLKQFDNQINFLEPVFYCNRLYIICSYIYQIRLKPVLIMYLTLWLYIKRNINNKNVHLIKKRQVLFYNNL